MRVESQQVLVLGYSLHRILVHPEPDVPVRAVALFYHGQGGYADRYPEVLEVFTRYGIRCIITDFPGHGRSPGRRGHTGNEKMLEAIIVSSFEEIGEMPYGVMGHSMGGLLALRHLVLAGKGLLPMPRFSWVSSPLITPGGGHSQWIQRCANIFAPIIPWFTISTGVTSAMCRALDDTADNPSEPSMQLWHRRVSLGWGVFLMKTANWLAKTAQDAAEDVPLLLTQGSADPVCPPEKARELFDRLGCRDKKYFEMDGILHEPFSGADKGILFDALEEWIKDIEIAS